MNIYVNGEMRADVRPLIGGDIGQNSDHVTDSVIRVSVPVASEKQLQECDVIKIVETAEYSEKRSSIDTVFRDVPQGSILSKLNQLGATKQIKTTQSKNIIDLSKAVPGSNTTVDSVNKSTGTIQVSSTSGIYKRAKIDLLLFKGQTLYACYNSYSKTNSNAPVILQFYIKNGAGVESWKTIQISSTQISIPSDALIAEMQICSNNSATDLSNTVTYTGVMASTYPIIAFEPFVPNSPSFDYKADIGRVSKTIVNGVSYPMPDGCGYDGDSYDHAKKQGTATKLKRTFSGGFYFDAAYANTVKATIILADMKNGATVDCEDLKFIAGSNSDVEHITTWAGWNGLQIYVLKSRIPNWSDSWTTAQKTNAINTFLSTSPLTIVYPLATPVQITNTPISIPVSGDVEISSNGGTVESQIQYHPDKTIYAGTILAIKQDDMGTNPDLSERYFSITLASNAYLLAKVYTDMQFPKGANATQILRGNRSGDAWYSASLGEFAGLFDTRIAPEGITLGTIDDFTGIVLNSTALLWGQAITDTLDDIAAAAGAWWIISNDRVFSMQFSINRGAAPFALDTSCKEAYDLTPSRDAYTMYSAVRIIGGSGKGAYTLAQQYVAGQQDFKYGNIEIKDATHAELKFPIHSLPSQGMHSAMTQRLPNGDLQELYVGWKGLDDNNTNYAALVTYGGTEIELREGYTFATLGGGIAFVSLGYYPLIPVVVRLVDPKLSAEVKAQRGGTGIIEAIVTDKTIVDYSVATQAATAFLSENGKRALTVEFKTKNPNFCPGQILPANLPYYNVVGDYQITETKGTLIAANAAGNGIWEFRVQASTAAYRDSLKSLFYQSKKTEFKLGTDFPANDGTYIESDIEVKTDIDVQIANLKTWAEIDAEGKTWAEIDAEGKTWAEMENVAEELSTSGNYLTAWAKGIFLSMFQNQFSQAYIDALSISSYCHFLNGSGVVGKAQPIKTVRTSDGITNVFQLAPGAVSGSFTALKMTAKENTDYSHDYAQAIPADLNYAKYPQADIIVSMKNTITAPYLTPNAYKTLLDVFTGANVPDGFLNFTYGLLVRDDAEPPILAVYLAAISSSVTGGDSLTQAYYMNETQQGYLKYAVDDYTENQNIPLNIDKSASNPKGPYALSIIKKDKVI